MTAPVRPRRRLYYGWLVLGVSVTGAFLASTTSQLFTGAMLPDIEEGTGWSRSSITLAVTIGSMTAGFSSPIVGRLADRYGARYLTAAGAIVVAVGMFMLAFSSAVHLILFYAGYIVGRGVAQNTLAGVVPRTTAVNWFRRMRGRSLGIVSMAIPLGGASLVPIAKLISSRYGWETVYVVFALVLLAVVVPLALLVLRRRPEDMGLLPDGDEEPEPAADDSTDRPKTATEGYDFRLAQAMRTPAFWMLIAAMTCGTCSSGGLGFIGAESI